MEVKYETSLKHTVPLVTEKGRKIVQEIQKTGGSDNFGIALDNYAFLRNKKAGPKELTEDEKCELDRLYNFLHDNFKEDLQAVTITWSDREKYKESKRYPDQADPTIRTLVETAKEIELSTPESEYSHALKIVATRGLGSADIGDSKEKQRIQMKETVLNQIMIFEETQEGGGRKLLEIPPETLKEMITKEDLESIGIKQ